MLDAYTQRLMDEFACRRLIEHYWWAQNKRDSKTIAALFTEDGRWGAAVGREAITAQGDGYWARMTAIAANWQGFGAIKIDVDGDEGRGDIEGVAHLVLPQPDGGTKVVVVDAIYDVGFRRVGGEWRIARMTAHDDPSRPHGASFQFVASGTAIDFGMGDATAQSAH